MKIVWSADAQKDIANIYRFYAQDNEKIAAKLCRNILKAADILIDFPLIAPVEPLIIGHKFTFHSLVILSGSYKLIYFTDKETVVIIHVWDCRQNPENIRQY